MKIKERLVKTEVATKQIQQSIQQLELDNQKAMQQYNETKTSLYLEMARLEGDKRTLLEIQAEGK